jgi:small subunit ribosomal protein S15
MPITREARQGLVEKYRRGEKDTGSSEVQVALLTQRIQAITEHLASHKKDHATRRGLLMLVGKRNTLLKYLARESPGRYQELIESLGLRK